MIKNSKKLLEFKYLNQLFHRVRIVDPIKKIVIEENGEKTTENKKCYNRRYINEKLPIDIESAKANKLPLSIAMIDIDYFKLINDKYGHLLGDLVLKDITNVIKNNIRGKSDWIARYGGEEFLILFNDTSKEDAYNLSKRIKSVVENSIFKYDDIEINITISIGIASLTSEIDDMDKLIRKADEKLYIGKTNGRNQVIS
mgnify:CR=1 FL=1